MENEKPDISVEIADENNEKPVQQSLSSQPCQPALQNPLPVVRVPVKHANLGIRSLAMYEKINSLNYF